jgi:hypothetical protein
MRYLIGRSNSEYQKICEEDLKDRYGLQVIDICQPPALAKGEQIMEQVPGRCLVFY